MTPDELKELYKDQQGRWRTANLFEETCEDPAKYPPIFTLKDSDTASCVSLKQRYMEARDESEYLFAQAYLGGWDHWQRICESYRVKPYIEAWRAELKVKLEAEYIRKVHEIAQGEGPAALQAAKWLAERGSGKAPKRGRPSKHEREGYLKASARDKDELAEDAARLGLSVVK